MVGDFVSDVLSYETVLSSRWWVCYLKFICHQWGH